MIRILFILFGLLLSSTDIATAQEQPVQSERQAWDAVKDSSSSSDIVQFLETYPTGEFAEDARTRLLAVLAAELNPNAAPAVEETPPTPVEEPTVSQVVSFNVPLENGAPEIVGQSIAELIKGSPLFPPVEGLPESFWKDQECSNCHQWEQANLCDQANSYLSEAGSVNLTKQHPYGGTFKQNLRVWADQGCQ